MARRLTALGIDEPVECPQRYPEVSFMCYDSRSFPVDSHTLIPPRTGRRVG
jgi:hypothetical protein